MLADGFMASTQAFPDSDALDLGSRTLTYQQLYERAAEVAATLQVRKVPGGSALTAILGQRGEGLYAGILGILMTGDGYVPLNPAFPVERNAAMLERSEAHTIVVDASCLNLLPELLRRVSTRLLVLVYGASQSEIDAMHTSSNGYVGYDKFELSTTYSRGQIDGESIAYVLFTSGSTGVPKGVMVSHANVAPVVDAMIDRYNFSPGDRCSQTFDVTFDLSVFDMFVTWSAGACLVSPRPNDMLAPSRYITDRALTSWFSVPATGGFMRQLNQLKDGQYSRLRLALFCGEALPVDVAQAWTRAAPNARIENLYGPTEVTIACMLYAWNQHSSPSESEMGVVPIGHAFPLMRALVVDEDLLEVAPGELGELLMAGPQVTPGYWRDPERTAAAFIRPPGESEVFYRTGDRVRRPVSDGPVPYLGRMDSQVQVNGYRVELGEIEAVARDVCGLDAVVAVPWPVKNGTVAGIHLFVGAEDIDGLSVRNAIAARLPSYMVPRTVHLLVKLPVNANGKFDRNALARSLENHESS